MQELNIASNPFGMMIDPASIIDAMNRSDRLERLERRVYRPLDKPMIPKVGAGDVADAPEEMEINDTFGEIVSVRQPVQY